MWPYSCFLPLIRAKSRVMTPLSSINGTRLSIRSGFVKNMSIPDPIVSRCNSICATPVRATILTCSSFSDFLSNSRMHLADSRPSMTGIEISEKVSFEQISKSRSFELTHQDHGNGRCICFVEIQSLQSIRCSFIVASHLLHEFDQNPDVNRVVIHDQDLRC